MKGPQLYISRYYLLCLLLFASSGCLKLKLGRDMVPGEGDWAMEGATEERQQAAAGAIDPPLYEQWRYDVGAGVGPAGALIIKDVVIVGTRKGLVHGIRVSDGKRLGRIKHDAPIEGGLASGGGLLFVPMAGDKRSIVAYELWTGKKKWKFKGKPVEAGLLYHDGTLIAVDVDANVIALDAASGDELWRKPLRERTTVTSSPLIIGDQLFVIDESGILFALALESGDVLWERYIGAPVYNTASTDGERIYIPTTRGRLVSVFASDGSLAWNYALPDSTVRFSAPAYAARDNQLIVSATSGEVHSFDAVSGEVRWVTAVDGAINSAPLITKHTIYVGTMRKHLHALDIDTGIELWSHEVTGRIKSAVTGYGNRIIVMAETQQVLAFSPDEPEAEASKTEETP